jgi:hypothetical protein
MQSSLYGGQGMATGQTSRQGLTGLGNKVPKGFGVGRIQQFTPDQLQLFQQLFSNLGPDSFLSRLAGGDESAFQESEAPALRQFGQLQGNIASRFSAGGPGPGALSSRHSSGFGHEMNAASSNFAQDLMGKRQGLQRQALMDLFGLSEGLLSQRPYEKFLVEKPVTFSSRLGSTFAGAGTGAGVGFGLGGPKGAALGALLGGAKAYGSAG